MLVILKLKDHADMIVVRAIALLVIAAVAGLVFELQNIWPFNHDRVLLLTFLIHDGAVAGYSAPALPLAV